MSAHAKLCLKSAERRQREAVEVVDAGFSYMPGCSFVLASASSCLCLPTPYCPRSSHYAFIEHELPKDNAHNEPRISIEKHVIDETAFKDVVLTLGRSGYPFSRFRGGRRKEEST